MEIADWNERVFQIKSIKDFINDNTERFANDRQLQYLWGTLNRSLIDLNESIIDDCIININKELYDE
ncbi:MAG: hypothetical protein EOL97_08655 [Spirochaetia bacterium]|nr:hypothetical protein [Spirochaetia bacterium]